MATETYAYFLLDGVDLDPEEITRKVGIVPTKTFLKGDRIHPKGSRTHDRSGWQVRSNLEQSVDDLDAHIRSVLDKLKTGWQPLIELIEQSQQYDAWINCVMYYTPEESGTGSGFHFDRAILEEIHQLKAEIDFDLYVLPPEISSAPTSDSGKELAINL
jgi:Domain of unknown function (DUF4279)